MKKLTMCAFIIMISSNFTSCREFYDDDFLADRSTIDQESRSDFYSAQLLSTDQSLVDLRGNSSISMEGSQVSVSVQMEGIPQNISQIHYTFSGADCATLVTQVPSEIGDFRTYNINETMGLSALTFDLRNAGAGDANLEGKSLVIKGYSSIATGGASFPQVYNIACGQIAVDPNGGQTTNDTEGDIEQAPTPTPDETFPQPETETFPDPFPVPDLNPAPGPSPIPTPAPNPSPTTPVGF